MNPTLRHKKNNRKLEETKKNNYCRSEPWLDFCSYISESRKKTFNQIIILIVQIYT
jgi:hypothetical protein